MRSARTCSASSIASASKATQAQSRIKRLAKLEPIAEVVEERVAPFTLPSPTRPLAPPHKNVLAAALANKLARIVWAVLYHRREYDAAFTLSKVA